MNVLSVKQPWAYLMCVKAKQEDKQAIKDVENRTWKLPEKYKGERVLIHASGKTDKEPYMLFTDKQAAAIDHRIMRIIESYYTKSAIIGSVRFVDCVINHPSIWAEKSEGAIVGHSFYYKENQKPIFNWAASDPILFDKPILGVKGKLGFWNYPADILICPYCGKVCLHDNSDVGVPNWGNPVHECEHCKEMILESEFKILK